MMLGRCSLVLSAMFVVVAGADAVDASRPNVLLVIADDQSYPHTSAYGSSMVQTPAFDRVAQQGVMFTRAIAPSPGCSPCRAALLTGRYPWQLEHAGTHASEFPQKFVTFPTELAQAGYFVGYTGKGWGPGNWQISGRQHNPAGPEFNEHKIPRDQRPEGVSVTDYTANFAAFLRERPREQPFCFWLGGHEPHRTYKDGIGLETGKSLESAEVPGFLPDVPRVRSDLLDYAFEIEWLDAHLARVLKLLEEQGELANTLIIVTSDNGMPFPRSKANCYEYGIHMPLAVQWPQRVPSGRTVDDLVSFVDLTATIRELAGLPSKQRDELGAIPGKSLVPLLTSEGQGVVEPERRYVFSARERHSSSRYQNVGYPQRAARSQNYLYIRNFKPERWPAGDPQELLADGRLAPPYRAFFDIDRSPTLTYLVEHRERDEINRYLQLAVAKRPAEEFFDVESDPACLHNLVESAEHAEALAEHRSELESFLKATGDPRAGDEGDVFESYPRYSPVRKFPSTN